MTDYLGFAKGSLSLPAFADRLMTKSISIAAKTAKNQVEAIELLSADEEFLQKIGFYLQEKPQTWLIPPAESDWHDRISTDIADVLPSILDEKALFIVHSSYRWVLVKAKERVFPFIFVDKGGVTHLIKMIVGAQSNWITVFDDLIGQMVVTGSHGGERFRIPEAVATGALQPGQVRDPKWDVTGVFLE